MIVNDAGALLQIQGEDLPERWEDNQRVPGLSGSWKIRGGGFTGKDRSHPIQE